MPFHAAPMRHAVPLQTIVPRARQRSALGDSCQAFLRWCAKLLDRRSARDAELLSSMNAHMLRDIGIADDPCIRAAAHRASPRSHYLDLPGRDPWC
jgi:hypothetical protein